MKTANFEVVETTESHILIRDVGPWDQFPTITNAAEDVVSSLLPVLTGRRLYYFDSEGDLGELVVKFGKFAGFAPCKSIPLERTKR